MLHVSLHCVCAIGRRTGYDYGYDAGTPAEFSEYSSILLLSRDIAPLAGGEEPPDSC